MPRLATYIIPEQSSQLYRHASAILSWDVFAVREVWAPDELQVLNGKLRTWVGPAHNFGFHATIGDALDYPDELAAEIESTIEQIAYTTAPFDLSRGQIHTSFRAFPSCLAATFSSPDRAVNRLEERIVMSINSLHVGSPFFDEYVDRFNRLQMEQFIRYGSPNVLALFDLHFTLSSDIPDTESWHRLCDLLLHELGLLSTDDQRTLTVDRIHLMEQRPDGCYRIRRTYKLTGSRIEDFVGASTQISSLA